MSQNITNTGLPTPATTQDWTTVLDKAIQSASEDDQETANVKYAECQHHKRVKKECKAAEEAVAHERAEVERWEKECQDCEECSYAMDSETKYYKVVRDASGGQAEGKCTGRGQAQNECASASRVRGPRASRGFKGAEKKKKQGLEEATSPRAGDKKKWVRVKSLELLQEMEYQQVAEVGELSDKESTGEETSDRETDKDMEGEVAPENDLEDPICFVSAWGYHKLKTESQKQNKQKVLQEVIHKGAIPLASTKPMRYSRGQHRGLEVPEEGNRGEHEQKFQVPQGYQAQETKAGGGQRAGGWQQVLVRVGGCQRRPGLLLQQLGAEEVQDKNVGEMLEQDDKGDMGEHSCQGTMTFSVK
ncbi:hypothetical protein EDC04DRAFT_2609162 [Pisolithus marmoratus]|nr:hypothetical protein EDC04DRAFT_2609162 [Pisolithus marmoratus]